MLLRRLTPLLLALAAFGCAGTPDGAPAPPPSDVTISSNAPRLPARAPLLVWLRTDRLAPVLAGLDARASKLGAPPLTDVLSSAPTLGLPILLEPKRTGFDSTRPVVGSLLGLPPSEMLDSAFLGNIPDVGEAPDFVHFRFFVPATDSRALAESLATEASGSKRHKRVENFSSAGDIAIASPLGLAVFIPEPTQVRVELAWGKPRDLDGFKKVIDEGAFDAARVQRADTPAWRHFVEGTSALGVYGSLGSWARTVLGMGLESAGSALVNAPPESMTQLYSQAVATVLTTATVMHPDQSSVYDAALSLDGGPTSLDLRLTRSLPDEVAAVYDEALRLGGPTYRALSPEPLLELRIGQAPRELLANIPRPAWSRLSPAQLAEAMSVGGPLGTTYVALQSPWPLLAELSQKAGDDLAPFLDPGPDSVTLVLERFHFDKKTGDPQIAGALAASFPAGTSAEPMRQVVDQLEELLTARGVPAQVFFEATEGTNHTLVVVGVGRDPRTILDTSAPLPGGGMEITYRPRPSEIRDEGLARLLDALTTVHLVERVQGGAQVTLLRLGASSPPTAPMVRGGTLPPRRQASAGERCLQETMPILQQGFEALAAVDPAARKDFFDAFASELEPKWKCAEADEKVAHLVGPSRTGLTMLEARLFMVVDPAYSRALATEACEAGRAVGCVLADAIVDQPPPSEPTIVSPPGTLEPPDYRGTMSLQKPTIEGALDAQVIRKVINAHRAPLIACYEDELKRDRTFAGTVDIRFRIDGRGVKARIASTPPRPIWEKCVKEALEAMEFPPPARGGAVEVSYPMLFAPQLR